MLETRYGIFLRPDPATCWSVTQATSAIARQFGLVAGAVFPPHATLIGNLNITSDEDHLIEALSRLFAAVEPFEVHNQGVRALDRSSIRFDVDLDSTGKARNHDLLAVADLVRQEVLPLHVQHDDYLAPNVEDYVFRGHLSLGSFDLALRPGMFEEVLEFTRGLPLRTPASFTARWFSLFRFTADWRNHWWNAMTWQHVLSWKVGR